MILVTGSEGLIGRRLCKRLDAEGRKYRRFDLKLGQDIRDVAKLRAALSGCEGVVHLAAYTRVKAGERNQDQCWGVNVTGLITLLLRMEDDPHRWLVFASSREVYGEQDRFPVHELALKRPKNIYGVSKLEGEEAIGRFGTPANIVRFSSVYGDIGDHPDRVVPAFARACALDETIRVCGADTVLDFVHVDDVVDGLMRVIGVTEDGVSLPPIHFVSGTGTTLRRLAELAAVECRISGPESIHVRKFVGDPTWARQWLNWETTIDIETGFRRLAADFRNAKVAA